MNVEADRILREQSGVISRRQALDAGLADHDIRRMLRRREWALVHDGVYVQHTGPLTWLQRAWSAVLFAWPAALCHDSALRVADGPGRRGRDDNGPIHVAVDRRRTIVAPAGIVAHRLVDLGLKTQWNLSPPRLRVEQAVLDVAAESADDFQAISVLSAAVGSRRTTAERVLQALHERNRIARRAFLIRVLRDIAEGSCSVLEHGYLTRVERPHGLPVPERQVAASSRGPIYRDVDYHRYGLVVELDGRACHDTTEGWDIDKDRDLDAAVDGRDTVRLGWGQVFARPCWTAPRIARLLQVRGWDGELVRCPDCLRDGVDLTSPGDVKATSSARAGPQRQAGASGRAAGTPTDGIPSVTPAAAGSARRASHASPERVRRTP